MNRNLWRHWTLVAVVIAVPLAAIAATPANKPAAKEPAVSIGLFEAMESGDLEVKLIPKDSTEGTITIKNKTGKPVTVKLPEAFAGVPVLAQGLLGGGNAGGGNNNNNGGGGNQGLGGGMMGGGMGGMGGMGGGFFNVGPEKAGKIKVVLVCLDHGKKDPSPQVPYQLVPVASYAKNDQVAELVKMLSRGEIDQRSAQAAAWNLQNGLSWEQLVAKIGVKHLNGSVEPYFTKVQLQRALVATKVAADRVEKATKDKTIPVKSPGETIAGQ
jgi:hypothetical protein